MRLPEEPKESNEANDPKCMIRSLKIPLKMSTVVGSFCIAELSLTCLMRSSKDLNVQLLERGLAKPNSLCRRPIILI